MKIRLIFVVVFFALLFSLVLVLQNNNLKTTFIYLYNDLFIQESSQNLLLGSSSVARLDSAKYLQCSDWINRGMGNVAIGDLYNYINYTVLKIDPEKIIIYAGENDISHGNNVESTISEYKKLLHLLLKKYTQTELHVLAIKPSPARRDYWRAFEQLNTAISKYSQLHPRIYFHQSVWGKSTQALANLFLQDGIHLTSAGYQLFTKDLDKQCRTE